ncbi:MAG: hypothetical protein HXK66_02465 [Clostridiales bacterium]|jgi:membrane protein|nr:hypothetical protein [Clostridiales bacterium]MBF0979015.1 hypothetical protein [Clostridiales bacterium]
MKFFLLLLVAFVFLYFVGLFKTNKIVKFAIISNFVIAISIIFLKERTPSVYYRLFALILFAYIYNISGLIFKTQLIVGRKYRFALLLLIVFLGIIFLESFERMFGPFEFNFNMNLTRLVQVGGSSIVLYFIIDEFKLLINHE